MSFEGATDALGRHILRRRHSPLRLELRAPGRSIRPWWTQRSTPIKPLNVLCDPFSDATTADAPPPEFVFPWVRFCAFRPTNADRHHDQFLRLMVVCARRQQCSRHYQVVGRVWGMNRLVTEHDLRFWPPKQECRAPGTTCDRWRSRCPGTQVRVRTRRLRARTAN